MQFVSESLAIYLHIPFCTTKCSYCAFNTYTHLENWIEPFVNAMIREIEWVGASNPYTQVPSVFYGGGTPSLLTVEQFERLNAAIRENFPVNADAEWTLEANPNDLHFEYLQGLREKAGFNRISIGMQTTMANELVLFNRRHDNDAVARAVFEARRAGFNNLNLDLIYGFPHQTLETWENTLQQAVVLKPQHLSLYALGVEEGTSMKTWIERGRIPAPDDDLAADMYDLATDFLGKQGFHQYEISNWAQDGFECRHNLQYWWNDPYVGLGPGAHGFASGTRYSVLLSPQRYVKGLLQNDRENQLKFPRTPVTEEAHDLDQDDEIIETLLMGLRLTTRGVSVEGFRQRFGLDMLDYREGMLKKHIQTGLLEVNHDVVRLTEQGRLLSNIIFRDLV